MSNKANITYGRKLSRDEVLVMLSDNIQDLNHKIKNGKIRDKANARIKNAQVNSLVYLASNYLKGLRDEQLDEIKQELLEFKNDNVSVNVMEQHMIDNANTGVSMDELKRIESVVDAFSGD